MLLPSVIKGRTSFLCPKQALFLFTTSSGVCRTCQTMSRDEPSYQGHDTITVSYLGSQTMSPPALRGCVRVPTSWGPPNKKSSSTSESPIESQALGPLDDDAGLISHPFRLVPFCY